MVCFFSNVTIGNLYFMNLNTFLSFAVLICKNVKAQLIFDVLYVRLKERKPEQFIIYFTIHSNKTTYLDKNNAFLRLHI